MIRIEEATELAKGMGEKVIVLGDGKKHPRNPISVGEEYIVTIEETSKSGTGVAKIKGFVVLVNNSNPGERVKVTIKQVSRNHAVAASH